MANKNWKRVATAITTLASVLLVLTGVSLVTVKNTLVDIVRTPRIVQLNVHLDTVQQRKIELARHGREMIFEALRLLTDDDDTLWYAVAPGDGTQVFDVDVRATAEDVELAFLFDVWLIYPVYYAPADGRKYIIMEWDDGKQNSYLIPQ